MADKTLCITGVSGYIGGALCRRLEHVRWCKTVHGCDLRPPLDKVPKVQFAELSINDPRFADWVDDCAPDALVHLAFVLNPMRDEARMRRVNVEGTRAVLEAAGRVGVRQVMVASSGTAYGAWPDNPVPLRETDPIRPHPDFQYAREKSEVEQLCADFGRAHPDCRLSIIRPCVVYGANVSNYLSRLLTGLPVTVGLAGYNTPLQFVHEDDVARAILTILEAEATGPFNIAPPDTVTTEQTLRMAGKPVLRLPDWVLNPVADLLWQTGSKALGAPSSFLDFMRYPWVLDTRRLTDELGFEYRYSSAETLRVMLRAKGVLR